MGTRVDPDSVCMNCMEFLSNPLELCPNCGADNAKLHNLPVHLQMRSILYGKYLVGKVLGQGGFGITYIGFDLNLCVKVAIKEYFPSNWAFRRIDQGQTVGVAAGEAQSIFAAGKDRFLNEARVLAQISACQEGQSGIVSVRDFFHGNNTAYLVMDYIAGKTLKQALADRGGKMPTAEALELLKPIVRSMQRVHQAQVLHCDISPDNILVDEYGCATLIDFGAARDINRAANHMRSSGARRGKRELHKEAPNVKNGYTPPEQYLAEGQQGTWTDVYALCATVYRAITGTTPPQSLSRMLKSSTLALPSELGADIPSAQEQTLMCGLRLDVKQRIPDMQALWKRLYVNDYAPGMISIGKKPLSKRTWRAQVFVAMLALSAFGLVVWLTMQPSTGTDAGSDLEPEASVTAMTVATADRMDRSDDEAELGTPTPMPQPSPSAAPTPVIQETVSVSPSSTPQSTPSQTAVPTTPQPSMAVATQTASTKRQIRFDQDGVQYLIDRQFRAVATAYTGENAKLELPPTVGGVRNYPLRAIAAEFSKAASKPAKLKALVLPDLPLVIEDGAFSHFTSLASVSGGGKVESVSKAALEGTAWLKSQRIEPPESALICCFEGVALEYLGNETTVSLDASIRNVAPNAFENASSVKTLIVEGEVVFQAEALAGLSQLETISVKGSIVLEGMPFAQGAAPITIEFEQGVPVPERLPAQLPTGSTIRCQMGMIRSNTDIPDGILIKYLETD